MRSRRAAAHGRHTLSHREAGIMGQNVRGRKVIRREGRRASACIRLKGWGGFGGPQIEGQPRMKVRMGVGSSVRKGATPSAAAGAAWL